MATIMPTNGTITATAAEAVPTVVGVAGDVSVTESGSAQNNSNSQISSPSLNLTASWTQVAPTLQPVSPNSRRTMSQKTGMSHLSPYRLQKHLDIRAKIAVETRLDRISLEDEVKRSFRSPVRKLYSRGHEIHEAGSEIAPRLVGTSPIVSRVRTLLNKT
jgi:hypothetical protein